MVSTFLWKIDWVEGWGVRKINGEYDFFREEKKTTHPGLGGSYDPQFEVVKNRISMKKEFKLLYVKIKPRSNRPGSIGFPPITDAISWEKKSKKKENRIWPVGVLYERGQVDSPWGYLDKGKGNLDAEGDDDECGGDEADDETAV